MVSISKEVEIEQDEIVELLQGCQNDDIERILNEVSYPHIRTATTSSLNDVYLEEAFNKIRKKIANGLLQLSDVESLAE